MNEQSRIEFFENDTSQKNLPSESVSAGNPSEANDASVALAKILMGVFGLFLVIIVPLGMMAKGGGVLTRTEKRTPAPAVIPAAPRMNTAPPNSPQRPLPIPNDSSELRRTQPMPANEPSAQARDTRAAVLEISQLVREYSLACRRNGGIIRSGVGGQSLCENSAIGDDPRTMLLWPQVSICGPSPENTTWTVFRGDTDTWDITIDCALRKECNGPSNALCTKDGCTFSETCLPRE